MGTPSTVTAIFDNCSVCMEAIDASYTSQEKVKESQGIYRQGSVKVLPCNHAFHEVCIMPWLTQCAERKQDVTCPLCRHIIKKKDASRPSQSIAAPIPFNFNDFRMPPLPQMAGIAAALRTIQTPRIAIIDIEQVAGLAAAMNALGRIPQVFALFQQLLQTLELNMNLAALGMLLPSSNTATRSLTYIPRQNNVSTQTSTLSPQMQLICMLVAARILSTSALRVPESSRDLPNTAAPEEEVEQVQEVQQQRPTSSPKRFFEGLYNIHREVFNSSNVGLDLGGRHANLSDLEVAREFLTFAQEKNLRIQGVTYFERTFDRYDPYFLRTGSYNPIKLQTTSRYELHQLGVEHQAVWQIYPSSSEIFRNRFILTINSKAIFRDAYRLPIPIEMNVMRDEVDVVLNPHQEINFPLPPRTSRENIPENRAVPGNRMSATPWSALPDNPSQSDSIFSDIEEDDFYEIEEVE